LWRGELSRGAPRRPKEVLLTLPLRSEAPALGGHCTLLSLLSGYTGGFCPPLARMEGLGWNWKLEVLVCPRSVGVQALQQTDPGGLSGDRGGKQDARASCLPHGRLISDLPLGLS
jgi:hypothetical protein